MLSIEQRAELNAGIGASECGTILGVNPYMTPYELWLEKTGRSPREDISQEPRIIMGHMLEPVIAKRYAQLTGERVAKVNAAYKHKQFPHMICHLDRKIIGKRKAVEIKTANPFSSAWGDAGTDEVPLAYIAQVQHQLAVTGWEENDLIVFRGTTDLRIYPFKRDEDLIKTIVTKVNYFWDYHLGKDIAPPPTTRDDLKLLYPINNGNFIEATPLIHSLLGEHACIKVETKKLAADKLRVEQEIAEFIADNDGIKDGDRVLATLKANVKGSRTLLIK